MNNFTFTAFITSNIEIDKNIIEDQIENLKTIQVDKGHLLLQQGDICKHSFYVEQGLLRYFSIDEKGKEHILQFAPQKWFLSDRESVYFNQPSNYYIDALETSRVVLIDEDFIIELSQKNKAFTEFNNRLLHNHIRQMEKRINQLLSATAEERYLDFIKIYPDLLLRVPQWMVASYLGVTPESLSRIRKSLAAKNFKG